MDSEKRSWGVKKRLEFIERRLYWEGRINRSDLIEFFNISAQQASSDLSEYQSIAPHNVEYDKNAKHYRATISFQTHLGQPSTEWYLAQLLASVENRGTQLEWLSRLPSYDAVPSPRRSIATERLRALVQALQAHHAIEVLYQSFSQSEPLWRTIAPHALAYDGLRWHTRAYCYRGKSFKDFSISRIFEIKNRHTSEISSLDDAAWHECITLIIVPHPDLSEGQKKLIAQDYDMHDGQLKLSTRIALIPYVIRHLRLDLDKYTNSSKDCPIVLLNKQDLNAIKQKYQLPES